MKTDLTTMENAVLHVIGQCSIPITTFKINSKMTMDGRDVERCLNKLVALKYIEYDHDERCWHIL